MLKQENALIIGLATVGVVAAVNQVHMPANAAVRASAPANKHIEGARKTSTLIGAAAVTIVWLLSDRDPTVFIIGGLSVIAFDFGHRIANATDNQSGKVPAPDPAAAPVT